MTVGDAASVEFGTSIAVTSDGILVGAPAWKDRGIASGGVIPFLRAPGVWSQGEPIVLRTPMDAGRFGASVAAYGSTAVIAAVYPAFASASGFILSYERSQDRWVEKPGVLISAPGGSFEPGFGRALAMTEDLLVIGSEKLNDDQTTSGTAYVSEKSGGAWGPLRPLLTNDASESGFLGWAVAASSRTVVIADPFAGAAGSVYVFERGQWASPVLIRGGENAGAKAEARFGLALALDETHLYVGAPSDGDQGEGSVYAFERIKAGQWEQRPKLISKTANVPDGVPGQAFGSSVAVAFDRVFVGAPNAASRVQAFDRLAPNDEVARLLPLAVDSNVFGGLLASSMSVLIIGSQYRADAYVLDLGAPCGVDSHCVSGHCVEGVCCSTTCDGSCSSCLAELKGSGGSGVCGPVRAGTDPKNSCEADESDCGKTGACDGAGACAQTSAGILCMRSECLMNAAWLQPGGQCNGQGACVLPGPRACPEGYRCENGACFESCENDGIQNECAPGFWCFGGKCVSGGRCSPDGRTAFDENGVGSSCQTARCRDGICPNACQVTDDCLAGFCDSTSHECVDRSELQPRATEAGCSCDVPSARAGGGYWLLLALAGTMVGMGRIRPLLGS